MIDGLVEVQIKSGHGPEYKIMPSFFFLQLKGLTQLLLFCSYANVIVQNIFIWNEYKFIQSVERAVNQY